MSGMLLFGDTLVRLPSARIARTDVGAVRDAADLLAEARDIRDGAQAASDEARAQGYADGLSAARAELATVLGELTDAFASANTRRAEAVAAAAAAVVEQLIGAREPDAIVLGLATQALRGAGAGEGVRVVEVHPDVCAMVSERLREAHPDVDVQANPALGVLGCRVLLGDGQIVADLDTQLTTLRARWGLSEGGEAKP